MSAFCLGGCGTALPPSRGYRERKWCSEKCRKLTLYARYCVDCGGICNTDGRVTDPSSRCRTCSRAHQSRLDVRREVSARNVGQRRRWSDEDFARVFQKLTDRGELTTGGYARMYARSRRGSMPSRPLITMRFGSWNQALEALGFAVARPRGPYAGRLTPKGALLAVEECAAALNRLPSYNDYEQWAKEVGAPSATLVRIRWGNWMALVDAVAARQQDQAAA